MQERFGEKSGWRTEDLGNGHVVYIKKIDPEILALMPENGRNFFEFRPFEGVEGFVNTMKKLLKGKPNNLLP